MGTGSPLLEKSVCPGYVFCLSGIILVCVSYAPPLCVVHTSVLLSVRLCLSLGVYLSWLGFLCLSFFLRPSVVSLMLSVSIPLCVIHVSVLLCVCLCLSLNVLTGYVFVSVPVFPGFSVVSRSLPLSVFLLSCLGPSIFLLLFFC